VFFFNDQLIRPEIPVNWVTVRTVAGRGPRPGISRFDFDLSRFDSRFSKISVHRGAFFSPSGSKNVGVANDGMERRVKRPFYISKRFIN